MTVTKIADAKADFAHWLEVRKGYLSSSDVFTWRGQLTKETDWWEDLREDIILVKQGGSPKEFDKETETSMWHGQRDEENIMRKFAHAVACGCTPENGFYVNDRWPMLGASIDGWGWPIHWPAEPPVVPEASQDRSLLPALNRAITRHGGDFLLEIKKSTSLKWPKKCPDYYYVQVQTQLAILECPMAIIVAECIHKGRKMKWRNYWDLRAHIIRPEPSWLVEMDKMNEEARQAFGSVL